MSNTQGEFTTGMAPAGFDASQSADQMGDTSAFPQHTSGFMGVLGGVGAAAHKGAPDKAAEMLSMQQSPTAEKVSGLTSWR